MNKASKKIFDNRFIYFLLIILNIFISLFFGIGAEDTFKGYSSSESFYEEENAIFILVLLVLFFSIFSLIGLILKLRKTIFLLNLMMGTISVFFVSGFIRMLFEGGFDTSDLMKMMIVLVLIIIVFFLINFFKMKPKQYENIEEIGKPE